MAEAEEKIIKALYVAAGIGGVIAKELPISGAKGGMSGGDRLCKCNVSRSTPYLQGETETQIINSASMALKICLVLSADPVAGLVEVPCIKRNVGGAVNAVSVFADGIGRN